MKKNKKGAIQQLQSLIVPLVAIGVVLAIAFLIMAEVKSQLVQINGSVSGGVEGALNATDTTINAIADIPGWLPIIVITVIGAILIGLVATFGGSIGRR